MYIECEMGLSCEYTDTDTYSMGVCKEYTNYGEGHEGIWIGHDNTGFWFYNEDQTAGHWVAEDGSVEGLWMYD